MSFYFTNTLMLFLLAPVLAIIWPWRKRKPRRFVIGGFFGEQGQSAQAEVQAMWPRWWLLLLASCCLAIIAMSQPRLVSERNAAPQHPIPFIVSAVPITSETARAQIVDASGALSLHDLPIDKDLSIQFKEDRYPFANLQVYLPSTGEQWRNVFEATWPLVDIVESADFAVILNKKSLFFTQAFDIDSPVTPEKTAALIHELRIAVNESHPRREYATLLNQSEKSINTHTVLLTPWVAIAAALCALLSLASLKRVRV
ncbi:MAG: hypothetical protein CMJ93_01525 [Planctomycetes bacterium]|nr:hypothetical protein [Planctomycetota bacterium]